MESVVMLLWLLCTFTVHLASTETFYNVYVNIIESFCLVTSTHICQNKTCSKL